MVKLRELAHSRTGDKGNTSNISLIAYDERHYPLLKAQVTGDRVKAHEPSDPFLIAGPLGLVGLFIRLRLDDTPQFKALSSSDEVAQSPLREAVAGQRPLRVRLLSLFP